MPGPISELLSRDHARLDALLERSVAGIDEIEQSAYEEFRAGLLRHIAAEEKLLFPAAQQANGGEALSGFAKLRLQHGALAALLKPTPTLRIISAIRTILKVHNPLEEGPGGVYELCEQLTHAKSDLLLTRLRVAPRVPVSAHVDSPRIRKAIRGAVARAGFDPDAMQL